jgi:hypothetical protein
MNQKHKQEPHQGMDGLGSYHKSRAVAHRINMTLPLASGSYCQAGFTTSHWPVHSLFLRRIIRYISGTRHQT